MADSEFLSLTAPAGGPFIPVGFWAEEKLTEPFLVTIDALSTQKNVDPADLLYKPVCLTVTHWEGPKRYFHGIVRRLSTGPGQARDQWLYTLEVVPRLWFMSQTMDCRIFQQQTAEDILQKLFSDAGVSPVQFKIYGSKPTREYTVQMNETDLAFATRLIEEEGWFYFFQHSSSGHTLIITDKNTAFQPLDDPNVTLVDSGYVYSTLSGWRPTSATAYGQTNLKDYDLKAPTSPPTDTENTTLSVAGASARDVFRWPALSTETGIVTQRTRNWIEASEASVAAIVEGAGRNVEFCPGFKFTLSEDPVTGASNQSHVIRSVVHQGSGDTQWAGGPANTYSNSFTCFLATQTWRELPTTPRPRMYGIFSAVVIGPEGEEIYTDQYGRVKVLFPWDRKKDSTPGASVWLRVIMPWAGKNWGWQYIPRVGTEVAVAFMDGDVDRPVVVGGLYNADYMPPFALPDQKTKSGLRTRSSLKGGTSNFSEFSIDDKMGQELVFLHVEKDHKVEVENDESITIGDNQTIKIGPFDPSKPGGNQTVEIWNNRDITIDQGNDSLTLKQGDRTTKLSMGNMTTTLDMGDQTTKLSMGNMSVELSLGNMSTKADVGKIDETATQSITMTVGGSSVKIDQMGVTIQGMMVKINGQIQTQVQGLMTQVSGSAMTQISGAITMIG